MSNIDFRAAQKWGAIHKDIRAKLVANVFCLHCGVTTIVDYSLRDDKLGIVLEGKCKHCGQDVARFIESP